MTTNSSNAEPNPNEKATRRRFSAEYKLRILEAADGCTDRGQIGLLLRREGLYASHLSAWRRWRRRTYKDHPASKKPATESDLRHDVKRLQRENERLHLKLTHAERLLALQKKYAEMMDAMETSELDGRSP